MTSPHARRNGNGGEQKQKDDEELAREQISAGTTSDASLNATTRTDELPAESSGLAASTRAQKPTPTKHQHQPKPQRQQQLVAEDTNVAIATAPADTTPPKRFSSKRTSPEIALPVAQTATLYPLNGTPKQRHQQGESEGYRYHGVGDAEAEAVSSESLADSESPSLATSSSPPQMSHATPPKHSGDHQHHQPHGHLRSPPQAPPPPPPPPKTDIDLTIGRLLRSGAWRVAIDGDTGRPYYYCAADNSTTWDLANLLRSLRSAAASSSASPTQRAQITQGAPGDDASPSPSASATANVSRHAPRHVDPLAAPATSAVSQAQSQDLATPTYPISLLHPKHQHHHHSHHHAGRYTAHRPATLAAAEQKDDDATQKEPQLCAPTPTPTPKAAPTAAESPPAKQSQQQEDRSDDALVAPPRSQHPLPWDEQPAMSRTAAAAQASQSAATARRPHDEVPYHPVAGDALAATTPPPRSLNSSFNSSLSPQRQFLSPQQAFLTPRARQGPVLACNRHRSQTPTGTGSGGSHSAAATATSAGASGDKTYERQWREERQHREDELEKKRERIRQEREQRKFVRSNSHNPRR